MIEISLVIPCFNEEETIPIFYKEVTSILDKLDVTTEIIFIDDGSSDKTLLKLKELSETDNRVHYISFSRNFGKEAALLAGLQKSSGNYVVTIDVDMQDPPTLIPKMLEAVKDGGFDCVASRRVTRKGEPPIRSIFATLFYKIMRKMTDIEVVDGARDFRLMSRTMVNAILSLPERNRFSKGIFPWVGFKTKWFEYENIARCAGETKWSFWKLFLYSIDGIVAFSTKPLAIASLSGVVLFFASLIMIGFIIVKKLVWGDPVAGWSSMICIILFCSGIQLFTIGILGQYLAKTYIEVKQRPVYVIKEEK